MGTPKVRVLYPVTVPNCEAIRETPYANDTPETDKRCHHLAKYEIDGKKLCQKHAQAVALHLLLSEATG